MISQQKNFSPEKLQQLVDVAIVLHQQNDYEEMLRIVSQKLSHVLHADLALILMLNPRTQQTVKTIFKEGREKSYPRYHIIQTQLSGWMMKYDQPLISDNIKSDSRFAELNWQNFPFVSVLGMPIRAENSCLGSFILLKKDGSFDQEDVNFTEKMIIIAAPYLRNVQKIQDYFEAPVPESVLVQKYEDMGLLGNSPAFVKLLNAIEAAARCDVRVSLEGESGTGKELIARAIHQHSCRQSHAFVAIDCGAIPEHLIESELFGHVKGAFTGATTDRKGLMEEANGGTFFMDEINNLPYETQAKLLRALQEGEIRPVGSNKTHQLDVRFIAASSTSLRHLVEKHRFREDLFYRLHVYPIYVPTLDERRKDIPVLAEHFLSAFVQQQGKQAKTFHQSLLSFMCKRHWPGNVRELENFVERLVALAAVENKVLTPDILPDEFRKELKKLSEKHDDYPSVNKTLAQCLEEVEENIVRRTLQENAWKQRQSARLLGISEEALRYKMRKFGLNKPTHGLV
ncbi:sigma-54-dependent Fis family transcriptional regulator [candidate division KSB1 bacterium]|nr:sigma-54-dependent Fis family transcriptional regulator [candidate division KSB1 bacterium]RQW04383.1 MAG: sigma-54-dependent Fis family transcriptional regulator [candidate division KSB1 bacterium]